MQFIYFFELLPKFSNFVNSNDCIGKITLEYIRLYPVFIQKRFEINKKIRYFLLEKWVFQVIISDYTHSFFEEDI